MSDSHEWCRDVRRDEAIRAAEDAAAVPAIQHRDLPEIVADLRERVARLEAAEKQAASTEAMRCMTKMRRERDEARAERDAAIRERDAAVDDGETLRMSLTACDAIANSNTSQSLSCNRIIRPNYDCEAVQSVIRAVEREIALRDRVSELERERDAAVQERDAAKEECERLRQSVRDTARVRDFWHQLCATREEELKALKARVAELEAAAAPAPAANAGGKQQEPMAWMYKGEAWFDGKIWHDRYETTKDEKVAKWKDMNAIPLYAAPQPPRGWLTKEEREAVRWIIDFSRHHAVPSAAVAHCHIETANALLARSTPPRVKGPTGWAYDAHDMAWIAAIRDAGGEVADE